MFDSHAADWFFVGEAACAAVASRPAGSVMDARLGPPVSFDAAVEQMARKFCLVAGIDPEGIAGPGPAWRKYEAWARNLVAALKTAGT